MVNIFYTIEKTIHFILRLSSLISAVLVAMFILGLVLYPHGEMKTPLRLISHPIVLLLSLIPALDLLAVSPTNRGNTTTPARATAKALVLSLFVFTFLAMGETYFLGHTLFTPLVLVASSWLYLTSKNTRGLFLAYLPSPLSLLIVMHYLASLLI